MLYRTLGRTGLEVSAVALGCEGFTGKTPAEANRLMDGADAAGVNFIDIYASDPTLRSQLGEALRGRRDRFVLQGHIGSVWTGDQYERSRQLPAMRASFEDLLRRLDTDHIEVGMIHYVDAAEDFRTVFEGETIAYAQALKAAGVIGAIGLSSHNPAVSRLAVETGLVDVLMFSVNPCYDMQPPHEDVEQLWADENYAGSLHNINDEREQLYELCAREGVGIDVMKAYAGGDLLSAEMSPFGRAFTPIQCLEYALSRPAVAAVMVGCRNEEELRQALAWCTATDAEKDYTAVLTGLESFTWSGHCMYCGHCAPCPAGIDVASVIKFLNLGSARKGVPETVREHYRTLAHHAGECLECAACETRCPFGVKIRAAMRRAATLFWQLSAWRRAAELLGVEPRKTTR